MSVPPPLESGTAESVILDCDYEMSEEERGQLDVKWFFNGQPEPFLQWVPGMGRKPQLIGTYFKDHIDLDFSVHEDEHKAYRAVKLLAPTTKLAGSYMCKVSTFVDEDFQQRNLVIYALPTNIEFQHESSEDSVNISCKVEGIFPVPLVKLTWENGSGNLSEYQEAVIEESVEGLYNVLLHYELSNEELLLHENISQGPIRIGCELELPDTDVRLSEKVTYEPKLSSPINQFDNGSGLFEEEEESPSCDDPNCDDYFPNSGNESGEYEDEISNSGDESGEHEEEIEEKEETGGEVAPVEESGSDTLHDSYVSTLFSSLLVTSALVFLL